MDANVSYRPAGFWKRFIAVIIDGLILSVFNQILSLGTSVLSGVSGMDVLRSIQETGSISIITENPSFIVVNIFLPFLFSFIYYGFFYSTKGATPGKMTLGLKVIDSKEQAHISWGKAFLREVPCKMISSMVLMIGYIIAGFRDDKKALHDLLCETQVVEKVS